MSFEGCRRADATDPLRGLREQFDLPEGVIYLDGNSLGPLPRTTAARVAQVVRAEWGEQLIRAWNSAGWFDLPQRLGNKIAPLIGAGKGEVLATDSTSVNLFKVLSAAISIAAAAATHAAADAKASAPPARVVLSERSNFPTDLYIAQALCAQHGLRLELLDDASHLDARLAQGDVAVLMLTHVNYRSGAMHDMRAVTAKAHAGGALTVWDLAHSAGAVEVDLHAAHADFAIGCGYKYLNGGPGAPAFLWVHPRHAGHAQQPLAGWWGHEAPFEFTPDYRPAPGVARFLCGTQPMVSMAALECGVDTVLAAQPFGGMAALRAKSLALTDSFIQLVERRCAGHGLNLVTPRDHSLRGSQVSFSRAHGAYAIVQALIGRGVIGDFRAPDVLRFGFAPLYLGFVDVWNAVEHLHQVLESGEWRSTSYQQAHAVT